MMSGCTIDYKDELKPQTSQGASTGKLTVNVCVSGAYAGDNTELSEAEYSVSSYDLLVFDDATGQLQYKETGITPSKKEAITGSKNYLLDVKEIELPNTGKKRVIAIANADQTLTIPELVTSQEDEAGCTLLNEFKAGVVQKLTSAPAAPFVMVGETYIATSNGSTLAVTLSRTVSRVSVYNADKGAIKINSITVKGVASTSNPLAEVETPQQGATIDYAAITPSDSDLCAQFYVLPTAAESMVVVAEGTVNGEAFTNESVIKTYIHADYGCKIEYTTSNAKVKSSFSPEFDVEIIPPIVLSGHWLSDETEITLPYIAEAKYGFTFDVVLEEGLSGVGVVKNDSADWFDVEVVGENKVRVRALKENKDNERKSSFNVTAGGNFLKVDVVQQGVKDITTISFAGIEWMDRNVGATVRSNMAGSWDVKSYGYLFQWGRNIPFPIEGEVETIAGPLTPAEAMATDKFIVNNGGTQDWNSQGIEGTHEDYWDTVTSNPCPAGYRLPTYSELETILPYRLASLMFAKGRQNRTINKADGSKYQYVGFGTGAITGYQAINGIRGIMNQGTEDAYYLKWEQNNDGGTVQSDPNNGDVNYVAGGKNIVRISYIDGSASSDYPKFADADEFWSTNTPEQDIYFPCAGRRDADGKLAETGLSAFYWSRSMYKGNKTTESYSSGLFYFRPAGKYMLMVAPAIGAADVYTATEVYGYRNQAFPIRCVKE